MWASARREGGQEFLVAGVEVTLAPGDLLVRLALASLPRRGEEPRLVGWNRGKTAHCDGAILLDGELDFIPGADTQSLADLRGQRHLISVTAYTRPLHNWAHWIIVTPCYCGTAS